MQLGCWGLLLLSEPKLSCWSHSRAHFWGDSLKSLCLVRGRSLILCAHVSLLQDGSSQKAPLCFFIHSFSLKSGFSPSYVPGTVKTSGSGVRKLGQMTSLLRASVSLSVKGR